MLIFNLKSLVLIVILIRCAKCDEYLTEMHGKCVLTRRPYFCAKYRFMKFVESLSGGDNYSITNSTRIVRMQSDDVVYDDYTLSLPRQNNQDSEHGKLVKFLKRKAVTFLNSHGFMLELPDEAEILEDVSVGEARVKKKKLLLLPILVLAKLFKIKMLVSVVLFSVLVVKKIILVAALVFPAIVTSIKSACKRDEDRYYGPESSHEQTSGFFG